MIELHTKVDDVGGHGGLQADGSELRQQCSEGECVLEEGSPS